MNHQNNPGEDVAGNLITTAPLTSAAAGPAVQPGGLTVPTDPRPALERLVAFLNEAYPTDAPFEYELDWFDHYEDEEDRSRIVLPDDLHEHPLALRAVATLLYVTGGSKWDAGDSGAAAAVPGPLRFSLTKRGAWMGICWNWTRFVVADVLRGNGSVEEHVDALIAYLRDQKNLVELTPELLELI